MILGQAKDPISFNLPAQIATDEQRVIPDCKDDDDVISTTESYATTNVCYFYNIFYVTFISLHLISLVYTELVFICINIIFWKYQQYPRQI